MTMTSSPAAAFTVPPDKQARLRALLRIPTISASVALCLALVVLGVGVTDLLALRGQIGLLTGAALNSFFMYWAFTVVHDAIHRAAASNQSLNDWMGRFALLFFAPHVGLGLFRWAHIQHHRFTNGSNDPDNWLHGPWWSMPFRFLLIDVGYMIFVLRHGDASGRRALRVTVRTAALTACAVAVLTYLGYGWEVLLLWFVPSRITLVTTGFVFFWLPHVKNDVPAAHDVTLATSIRLGHEWLLHPLFQFHNYHLIHHLFPSMPSHRHPQTWRLLEPELRKRNLQVQHGFAIRPTVHAAN
ncbi:fatty acid desaturase [Rugamonas apoptosis]|uniref:Fatty acid desaturase n=1 Tax=Rugamonas apoptosis TaxID=2758570 RepID=A0A7W2F7Q9_9BURK|nr:fatty acid desaturase [Rugamonas apoptosis]MBA5686667.1 fatty acid desaturase [Rugamonas apoptosis]